MERAILHVLSTGATHWIEIADRIEQPATEVVTALEALVKENKIQHTGNGFFIRRMNID